MENLTNLNDLLCQQVKSIYDGEKHIESIIPKMEQKTLSTGIKEFLARSGDEKRRQLSRLGEVARLLNIELEGESNEGIRCIAGQKKAMLDRSKTNKISDSVLIIYQKVITSLQINTYQTAVACAVELEEREVAKLLRRCLREEKGIERQLGWLEEESIEDLANISITA